MPFVNELIEHNRTQLTQASDREGHAPKSASRFLFDVETVMALLRSRIVGQDAVLSEIEAMLRVVKAGRSISSSARPGLARPRSSGCWLRPFMASRTPSAAST